MANAKRDGNFTPTLIGVSNADGTTPVLVYADPTTHRLLVDLGSSSGTVTSVSVVTANGFAGTVATATSTPAITLTTTITGVLKGNGTAISAATAGSDYAVGSIGLVGGQTIAGSTLTTENLTLRANAADLTTGQVNVTSSLEASSTTVGSVALSGGLAVAKRVYALNMTVTNAIVGSITGNAATVTTNANLTGVITSVGNATSIASQTGTGTKFVVDNTPTLVTPVLGVATATSINGLTITSSTGVLTITNAKTLSVTNTLTLSGTDSTVMTFPTTSATIARTDAANTFTGVQTMTSPALTTPKIITSIVDTNANTLINIGATASAVNYVKITNAITGTAGPIVAADGETNVDLIVAAKGTGKVHHTFGTYGNITAYSPSGAGTATLTLNTSNIHTITMPAGNITIALSNEGVGQCFIINIIQDSVGSRTVTWFTTIKWAGGSAPTLTTTANKIDTLGFIVSSSGNYYGYVVGQNL